MHIVYGRRVRQARLIRRYTVSFTAAQTGIRQPRLSEIETAFTAKVSDAALTALSRTLDFAAEFFFQEAAQPIHRGSLLFRARASRREADTDYLAEYVALVGELFTALTRNASCPAVRVPDMRPDTDPAEAARVVREHFGAAPDEPIDHLTRKMERAGVVVAALDFDVELHERIDAFSGWFGDYLERPLVVVRSIPSWERTRWSLAHELGHLTLHRTQRDDGVEQAADRFANELLLPAPTLRRVWPAAATLAALLPLKQRWGLSLQALIQHGYHAGILDDERRTSLFKQMSNRRWPDGTRWRQREPGHDARDPEAPRLLGKMAEVGYGQPIRLETLSADASHWPPLLLKQIVGNQLRRPAQNRPALTVARTTRARPEPPVPHPPVIALRPRHSPQPPGSTSEAGGR